MDSGYLGPLVAFGLGSLIGYYMRGKRGISSNASPAEATALGAAIARRLDALSIGREEASNIVWGLSRELALLHQAIADTAIGSQGFRDRTLDRLVVSEALRGKIESLRRSLGEPGLGVDARLSIHDAIATAEADLLEATGMHLAHGGPGELRVHVLSLPQRTNAHGFVVSWSDQGADVCFASASVVDSNGTPAEPIASHAAPIQRLSYGTNPVPAPFRSRERSVIDLGALARRER